MTDPHPVPDEDPEAHIGDPIHDPWLVVPCSEAHPRRTCDEYEAELDQIEAAG